MKPLPKQAILIVNAMSRRGADVVRRGARQADRRRGRADRGACGRRARRDGHDRHATRSRARRWSSSAAATGRCRPTSISSWARTRCSRSCRWAPPTASPGRWAFPRTSTARSTSSPTGERKRIDLGCIDGDYFVNAAALGLSPLIADTVPHKLKRYLGMVGYLIWAVRCAFALPPVPPDRRRMTTGDATRCGRPRRGSPTAPIMAGSNWSKARRSTAARSSSRR